MFFKVKRNRVSDALLWLKQNPHHENITIDKGRLNESPVHAEINTKIHVIDDSKSPTCDTGSYNKTSDEDTTETKSFLLTNENQLLEGVELHKVYRVPMKPIR